jgi:hypothetical protein
MEAQKSDQLEIGTELPDYSFCWLTSVSEKDLKAFLVRVAAAQESIEAFFDAEQRFATGLYVPAFDLCLDAAIELAMIQDGQNSLWFSANLRLERVLHPPAILATTKSATPVSTKSPDERRCVTDLLQPYPVGSCFAPGSQDEGKSNDRRRHLKRTRVTW